METDPATELREAALLRAESLQQYKRDHAKLARLIVDARDAGIPLTHIAGIAGVSRMTVYSILDDHRKRTANIVS